MSTDNLVIGSLMTDNPLIGTLTTDNPLTGTFTTANLTHASRLGDKGGLNPGRYG